MKRHKETSSSEQSEARHGRRIAMGVVAGSLVLNACSAIESLPHKASITRTVTVAPNTIPLDNEPWLAPEHQELTVVAVSDPLRKDQSYSVDGIRYGFNKAGESISNQTFGSHSLEVKETDQVSALPDTRDDSDPRKSKQVRCYTGNQLKKIEFDASLRQRVKLGTIATTAIVLQNTPMCNVGVSAVKTSTFDGRPVTFYNPGVYDKSNRHARRLSASVVAHEMGHTWGLSHTTDIDCMVRKFDENGYSIVGTQKDYFHFYPVDTLIKKCGPLLDERSNERFEYGSFSTVMSARTELSPGPYSIDDLAKIDPKDYVLESRENIYGVYRLSSKPGEVHGIKLMVPDTHPLKKVDPTIDHITIGLQIEYWMSNAAYEAQDYGREGLGWSIQTFAGARFQTYRIVTNKLQARLVEGNKEYIAKPDVVYYDKTLNIAVIQKQDDKGKVYLTVKRVSEARQDLEKAEAKVEERNRINRIISK